MNIEIRESPKLWIVEQSMLAQGAAPETRRILVSSGVLRRAQAGERLQEHGELAEHLALVGQGHLRLWRPVAGAAPRVAGYRSAGEVAGEAMLGGATTHDESAEAMTDVEVLALPRDTLLELVARDAALGEAARGLLLARHRAAEERICALLGASVEERLADFLLAAAERWGIPAGESVRIAARLTHAEIATVIGSTRETVTGALGNLRRAGAIAHDRRERTLRERHDDADPPGAWSPARPRCAHRVQRPRCAHRVHPPQSCDIGDGSSRERRHRCEARDGRRWRRLVSCLSASLWVTLRGMLASTAR